MDSKACKNGLCGVTSCTEWRKGWPLKSGDFANLCDKCGSAYQQLIFCDIFHPNDTGWRECISCEKRLHCGCIASSELIEILDCAGVKCIGCVKSLALQPPLNSEKSKGLGNSAEKNDVDRGLVTVDINNRISAKQLNVTGNSFHLKDVLPPHEHEAIVGQMKQKDDNGTMTSTNLNIGSSEGDLGKVFSSFQQSRHLFPKSNELGERERNFGVIPQLRVARPPAEGRVKNQLLPRYWPRITDQELRQISGDSNSTIVPLFEKVLSASDAGRIGRLVLPKACAESYFPPITQPEGIPLRIKDIKGKEWVFQFRFWPNNNSRMYVLEGVTPCIQSMQLQAGDTVMFSRMDPEGKLLMGFRKASQTITTQNLPITSGYSAIVQSLKESTDPNITAVPKSTGGDFSWQVMERNGSDMRDAFPHTITRVLEKERSRNIGSKSKRLLIDSREALELKLTWEVQDMLFPPPTEKPSVVTLEDFEVEEYEEPPVLGKSSIFTARPSGAQEQWTPCDSCSKWRRLPADFLLPPKWTCMDNLWDENRSSCSAPDELSPSDLESLLRLSQDFKKQKTLANHNRLAKDHETANLNILGNYGKTGDGMSDIDGGVATTTKHPRHRPGCSCIVCIQPPSGKGKHKPTCVCNVCMTVKRRFKTLMMRKKKRQSEKEAEIAQKNQHILGSKDESEVDSMAKQYYPEKVNTLASRFAESQENGKGKLDLNCNLHQEQKLSDQLPSHASMTSLVKVASLPLDNYLKQNGLTSLVSEQQGSSGSHSLPQPIGEGESNNDDLDQNSNGP